MKYLFDAWAWVEYFEGGKKGEKVKELINSENEIYTLNLTISEVVGKAKKNQKDVELVYDIILKNSIPLSITSEIAKKAGIFYVDIRKKNPGFGMIDALLLLSAREFKLKLVTGDNHLKEFKETVFLE